MLAGWTSHLRYAVALAALLVLPLGCGKGEEERLRSELAEARTELGDLAEQNTRLRTQCDQLADRVEELKIAYDQIRQQEARLNHWARLLADRFGPSLWYVGPEDKPLPLHAVAKATPTKLVALLNARFAAEGLPKVILVGVENGVARVRIDNETQLTQSLGSAGATGFIQSVTYTLCSLVDIRAVDFDFKEGDHAVPGRYTR